MKFILACFLLLTIFGSSCKKSKKERGYSFTITNCLGAAEPGKIDILRSTGTKETFQFNNSPITILGSKGESITVTFTTNSDSKTVIFTIEDGINSVNFQLCNGLKFFAQSNLIQPGKSPIFSNLQTSGNYSVSYNPTNNSSYIIAPIQSLYVDATYPWQSGSIKLKIKGKNLADLFSNTPFSVNLSNDTTNSYLAFDMYSTDTSQYKNQFFISNSKAVINFNGNKIEPLTIFEASFGPKNNGDLCFDGLKSSMGTILGTDNFGGSLVVKQK